MPENTADSAPQSGTQTPHYPAHDADNGEEQKNRLGYMATEPTEDEIEGDGEQSGSGKETSTDPTDPTAA